MSRFRKILCYAEPVEQSREALTKALAPLLEPAFLVSLSVTRPKDTDLDQLLCYAVKPKAFKSPVKH